MPPLHLTEAEIARGQELARDVLDLEFCLGQLRHAYTQLLVRAPLLPAGYWTDERRAEFAKGLLGPVIKHLEQLTKSGASARETES